MATDGLRGTQPAMSKARAMVPKPTATSQRLGLGMMRRAAPRHDRHHFGVVFRGSLRQAGLMIVAGLLTNRKAPTPRKDYD
ncbi:hypothetical protein MC885_007921 [Smutsia gigantea]|nr:hypothetical protein MC885_007921 [Smutsia gigantea]